MLPPFLNTIHSAEVYLVDECDVIDAISHSVALLTNDKSCGHKKIEIEGNKIEERERDIIWSNLTPFNVNSCMATVVRDILEAYH